MLARLIYETPILAQARAEGHLLVIYGREADRVAKVLFQRGFKTVYVAQFKESYPCLVEPSIDFVKLKEIYEKKRNSVFGGRLWRSTSASRLKSVQQEERIEKSKKINSRPSSQSRKPWL
ncbi:hypothetical protein CRE_15102 [Caenorhabditis remanei]|uniref:Uncharacterized protein n=1 Tax=Caenorhabditis remanei TaxID=31234 RepID=E3NS84_CAERE|nr:hypothetical protein CRE_15102 [Caenorhabditis remanei]